MEPREGSRRSDRTAQDRDIRISLNGTVLDASTRFGGSISGAALWFYLPERGRFVMSLLPNPKLGFRRAGEVSNSSLTFTEGRERYDIQSTSRIVPAGGRFNLYVLHDPKWRPTRVLSNLPLIVGAADRGLQGIRGLHPLTERKRSTKPFRRIRVADLARR